MYYVSKLFEIPISHRLAKHKGRCFLFHGHNLKIEVMIKSETLNENDMVMDFSELKLLVKSVLDSWDHGLFINKSDKEMIKQLNCDLHTFDCDPTSEVLCKFLYDKLNEILIERFSSISVHSISIWETTSSKSIYSK